MKYLVKDLGDDLDPDRRPSTTDDDDQGDDELVSLSRADAKAAAARRADHIARLVDALRYEPCSPRCAELAALRHPAQEPPPGDAARLLPRQGPPPHPPSVMRQKLGPKLLSCWHVASGSFCCGDRAV